MAPTFDINSSNPLQPEPPRMQPRYVNLQVKWGSGGNLGLLIPPGGFAPLSTRESGLLSSQEAAPPYSVFAQPSARVYVYSS